MHPSIQHILERATDAVFDRLPRPVPTLERLAKCRIISHRGQHDNRRCKENTIEAFDRVADARAWGIELDIRWTRDLQPVVFHDRDLLRLFDRPHRIEDLTLSRLQEAFPTIPTLAQVVSRYGKRMHLMVEVKQEPWRNQTRQIGIMGELLQPLEPGRDFHLITMHPRMLAPFTHLPPATLVAIADARPARFSRWVLRRQWGGLCGHYLLIHVAMVRRHQAQHQAVGTGFASSRNCLFREINRGIDWIFSNDAVGLQAMVEKERYRHRSESRYR